VRVIAPAALKTDSLTVFNILPILRFMKIIAISAIALILGACATTKTVKVAPFTVSVRSPNFSAGVVDAQLDKTLSLGKLRKQELVLDYYPIEDAVSLQYKANLITYHLFLSKAGREAFVRALDAYKEDYSLRNLEKNSGKAKRKYGSFDGYLVWQLAKFLVRAEGTLEVEMGHYFKEKSPYFVLHQLEAEYADKASRDNNRTSERMMIYFTRAQADNLAALFEQEYLQSLVVDIRDTSPEKAAETDDYFEREIY